MAQTKAASKKKPLKKKPAPDFLKKAAERMEKADTSLDKKNKPAKKKAKK